MKLYDVIVFGAGTAGIIAALQAAREGAQTLLVEKDGLPGGTMTNARTACPGLFHAWGRQIIGGIGWELVTRCVRENGDTLQDFSHPIREQHWREQISINPALYALIADEALMQSGCEVMYDTMCAAIDDGDPKFNDPKIITLCTKTGLKEVAAMVIIDCTGDANMVTLAGLPTEKDAVRQPATYNCRIDGYDLSAIDMEKLRTAYETAVARGELRFTDISRSTDSFLPLWLQKHGDNANHILSEVDRPESSEDRTAILQQGRLALLKLYRFFRAQPGFEGLRFTDLAPQAGIRETVRIRGKQKILIENFIRGKVYPDAVCYSFYPVDLHTLSGQGLENQYFEEGKVGTVPRGALLPEGSRNWLAAGRCICCDRAVSSVVRIQATCMATGQAAGALAALAAKTGKDVEKIPMPMLRETLKRHGAILPESPAGRTAP